MEGSNNNLENVGNNGAQWRKKMLGSVVWNGGANSMMTVNNVYILDPSLFKKKFFFWGGGWRRLHPCPPTLYLNHWSSFVGKFVALERSIFLCRRDNNFVQYFV